MVSSAPYLPYIPFFDYLFFWLFKNWGAAYTDCLYISTNFLYCWECFLTRCITSICNSYILSAIDTTGAKVFTIFLGLLLLIFPNITHPPLWLNPNVLANGRHQKAPALISLVLKQLSPVPCVKLFALFPGSHHFFLLRQSHFSLAPLSSDIAFLLHVDG